MISKFNQTRLRALLGIALLLFVTGIIARLALADTPLKKAAPTSLQGSAGTQIGMGIATNSTTVVCLTDTGISEPKCIPFGAQLVLTCAAVQVYGFWTMADNADLALDVTTLEITDAGGSTGKGPGVTYNGGYRSTVNDPTSLGSSAVGYRSGACTTNGAASGTTGRPCRQTNDCFEGAGETCIFDTPAVGTTPAVNVSSKITCAYFCLKSLVTASVNCQGSFEP